jgi:polysaccharide export outer membrane protein
MHDLDLTDINVMNSPYFYLQPNDYIYQPSNKKHGEPENGNLWDYYTLFSLATTTFFFLLFKN